MPPVVPLKVRLAALIGDWRGVETVAPSAYNPDGAEIPVRYQVRFAACETVAVSDYQQAGPDDAPGFGSHGVYRSAGRDAIELYSFDTSGMPPDRFKGPLIDGQMALTAENDYGRWRLIQILPTTGEFVSRLELWDDEAGWKLFSEGRYTRADG